MDVMTHVLNDAWYGPAVAYWAEGRNVKLDAEGNVISFQLREQGTETAPVNPGWKTINAKTLRRGIHKLVTGEFAVRRDIAAQFVAKDWEYDVEGIDCAIQAAIFDEIVYG